MIAIDRNEVQHDGFILRPCGKIPGSFDCGKDDLNDFFLNDQLDYEKELLAKTYALFPEGGDEENPKALISFCNDSIRAESFEDRSNDFKKIKKQLPHPKRYNSLPAVKIARLGVRKEYHRAHVGTYLLNMTKWLFLTENRTGCRFITVDAYRTKRAVEFYKKANFRFMKKEEQEAYAGRLQDPTFESEDSDETVAMYYNLKWTQLD